MSLNKAMLDIIERNIRTAVYQFEQFEQKEIKENGCSCKLYESKVISVATIMGDYDLPEYPAYICDIGIMNLIKQSPENLNIISLIKEHVLTLSTLRVDGGLSLIIKKFMGYAPFVKKFNSLSEIDQQQVLRLIDQLRDRPLKRYYGHSED